MAPLPAFAAGSVLGPPVAVEPEREPAMTEVPSVQQPESKPLADESFDIDSSKELYQQGKHAYRLGEFSVAIDKWEHAYKLSELPQFLYNLSLAYAGLYRSSGEVKYLHKARALMDNYIILARADPDTSLEDAEDRIAEFDGILAEIGASQGASQTPVDDPPRSARTLQLAGFGTLGAGGVLLVTGTALGAFFGVRGGRFDQQREDAYATRPDFCADENSINCMEQDAYIETVRADGRRANVGLGVSLGVGAGLGLVGIGVGVALLVKAKKLQRSGVARHLHVLPTGHGLTFSGRF